MTQAIRVRKHRRRKPSGGFTTVRAHKRTTGALKGKRYIDTLAGRAYYVKTVVEDDQGHWDDHYSTASGYWVIHRGKKHDVYKIR